MAGKRQGPGRDRNDGGEDASPPRVLPARDLEPNGSDALGTLEGLANEDGAFVDIVRTLVRELARRRVPEWVYAIQIDNWFGPGWLGFRGKYLGRASVHGRPRAALVVPPFHPHRVAAQHVFRWDARRYASAGAPPLHRRQRSGNNLTNYISRKADSGVFLWWSGDTRKEDRGSVMVYAIEGEVQQGWYAGLSRRPAGWRFEIGHGVTRREFEELLGVGAEG
jgi:hypothetical protein